MKRNPITVSCVGLQCVIEVFPDHTHLLCYCYGACKGRIKVLFKGGSYVLKV